MCVYVSVYTDIRASIPELHDQSPVPPHISKGVTTAWKVPDLKGIYKMTKPILFLTKGRWALHNYYSCVSGSISARDPEFALARGRGWKSQEYVLRLKEGGK